MSTALVPVTKSGHLPVHCVNISFEISVHKPSAYYSSIHSWQLDMKYSISTNLVWRSLPSLKESIYVRKNASLQDAINSAKNGSTILVEPGSYTDHLYITKTLKVIATGGAATTHIFGEVSITACGVTLQGMTFYPSINSLSTITIHSSSASIINCRFVDSMETLALYMPRPSIAIDCEHCPHLKMVNNDFYGWKHAVVLKSAGSQIIQTNTFRSCQTALSIVERDSVTVTGNHFMDNTLALVTLTAAQTDKLLNENIFSGNVIPLFCNGRVLLYPTENQYSKQIHFSQRYFVTGLCNATVDVNVCLSIGYSQSSLGTYIHVRM